VIGGGGVYAITPTDVRSVWGGYYEPRTLIWRNRWITRNGIVECRQAPAFPGDPDRVVLLRPRCAAPCVRWFERNRTACGRPACSARNTT
jgi:hypothetical protein